MTCLTDLPAEILLPVLFHLSRISLPAFLASQATCKVFRLLAQDIISRPPAPILSWPETTGLPGEEEEEEEEDFIEDPCYTWAHPLLLERFGPLFHSAHCFTREERDSVRWFLTLDGDVARPFRRLPWAGAGAQAREVYLRPGASWRHLSVTFGLGPPVTRVEVVKSYSSEDFNEDGRDHVQYLLADLPRGGFLTMGLLYDLLLCGGAVGDERAVTFGDETGSWELLLGRRLRSYELLVEYECFIADDEDLVDMGPEAAQSAILYVRGGTVGGHDQDRRFAELEDEEVEWVPEVLGDMPSVHLTSG